MKRIIALLLVMSAILSCFAFSASAEDSAAEAENPLEGKSALFLGDSACAALGDEGALVKYGNAGWAGRIIYNNKMIGTNVGVSGASMSTCRGTNRIIEQMKPYIQYAYDFIVFNGGGNDAWDEAPVGNVTEGFDGPFDTATFAGGFEETIKYAKENFPNAKIGFIMHFRMPSSNHGKLSDMTEYMEEARKICEKWNIFYLDLYNDDNLNENLLQTHTNTYLPDYIHPNAAGYDILTPFIENWMKEIAVAEPETESSDASEAPADTSEPEDKSIPPYVFALGVIVLAVVVGGVVIVVAKGKENK